MISPEESATTAIFDITHECLESFDRIAAKHDGSSLTRPFLSDDVGSSSKAEKNNHSSHDFIGLHNSFLFWVGYTGALSLTDSSLDTRLHGLADVSSTVIEFLDMIMRNLQRIDGISQTTLAGPIYPAIIKPGEAQVALTRWEDASRAIDFALNRLHFLAAAIRKASVKQLEYNVATSLSENDIIFHKDAVSLVRWKFPAARKGLCQQLGDSIAARRRMLLQKHHHAKKLTVRRVPNKGPIIQQKRNLEVRLGTVANSSPEKRMVHRLNIPTSGITKASRPDPHAPALTQIHIPKRPALTTLISTIPTSQEDTFEYPPRPTANPGESRVQCPYCLVLLDSKKLLARGDEYWKHHIDDDIKPYSCLFPECAEALLFFTRRKEWKAHMELAHSRDWPRKVHTVTWYCDIDHDPPELFEAEGQWRKHMEDPASHPKRKLPTPSKAQLDAISPKKKKVALRDQYVCPLCEQVPSKIRHSVEQSKGQMPDMQEYLFEHIASHIKSLSLLSVPCLNIDTATPAANEQSVSVNDFSERPLNQGSAPKPPSGIEHLGDVSLLSATWSTAGRMSIAPTITPDSGTTWDIEHSDYEHPNIPPDQLLDEWLKVWATWREDHDRNFYHSPELDPILAHPMIANETVNEPRTYLEASISRNSDLDAKNEDGRTMLSLAAGNGDVALVKTLLSRGVDIDTVDQNGRTPLVWAAECGSEEIVEILLAKGADIEAADQQYGRTPLSWAASRCHEGVVKRLLEYGAYVDAADNSSRTPLWLAAARGHKEILRIFLCVGARVDAYDDVHGRTPLLWAATRGDEAAVDLLISHGSDVEVEDIEHDRTPLSWAAGNGHTSVVNALLKVGANIEAADRDYGQTPLSFAAESGHLDVVKLLINAGADVHATDRDGQTARSWAVEKGHEAISELL